MTYFCYLEREGADLGHMEPMKAGNADDARVEAERKLYENRSGRAVHVFRDERPLLTVRKIGRRGRSGLQ